MNKYMNLCSSCKIAPIFSNVKIKRETEFFCIVYYKKNKGGGGMRYEILHTVAETFADKCRPSLIATHFILYPPPLRVCVTGVFKSLFILLVRITCMCHMIVLYICPCNVATLFIKCIYSYVCCVFKKKQYFNHYSYSSYPT